MALGVNIQWGYAGLFNVGVMGFAALGGLTAMLVSMPPVQEAWAAAGSGAVVGLLLFTVTVGAAVLAYRKLAKGMLRTSVVMLIVIVGYVLLRIFFDPTTTVIEKVNPALSGYLGGLGLPIILAWPLGGLLAGAVAWVVGKITLGLRSDYQIANRV